MPKTLAKFKPGKIVTPTCYQPGCGNEAYPVTLGSEYEVHQAFKNLGQTGRISWKSGAETKGFYLGIGLGGSGYCYCLNCQALFKSVIIISRGRGKKPLIFGYD